MTLTSTRTPRADATRKRLLDATLDSLYLRGYGGTTTRDVQERAGVSRGALLHHFSTRNDLMIAAVEHLMQQRMADSLALVKTSPPDGDRVAWAVSVLWDTFRGPLYVAALELWLAARNDDELLAALKPQERVLGQLIRSMGAELFGEISEAPRFHDALEVLLDAQRGAAARGILRSTESDAHLLGIWTDLVRLMTA